MDFTDAVDEFVSASPWLGAAEAPAVATLRSLARRLDGGDDSPALVGQFGLTHRALLKRAPVADSTSTDPLAVALAGAEA